MADAPALTSFAEGLNALVFGAGGGVGGAFAHALAAHPRVGALTLAARQPMAATISGAQAAVFDLGDEASIAAAVEAAAGHGPLNLVIVATGVLHRGDAIQPEKSLRSLSAEALAEIYAVNAIGPALIAKHAAPKLASDSKSVLAVLSARVGSISDNGLGGWHGYRASKAALNMIWKNVAIETARKNAAAVCIGLHPGTVDTGLSKPFQSNVRPGKLFTPQFAASRLLSVIDSVGPEASGKVFAWDGAEIPA